MRRPYRLAIIAMAVLGTVPALCNAQGHAEALAAAAIAPHVEAGKPSTGKAVSPTDKAIGELIGTVAQVVDLGSVCGVRATFVVLAIRKPYPFVAPAGVTCPGNSLAAACRGLKAGQRVRLQGNIGAVPDPSTDGFVACNPNTWESFLPAFSFAVTKVSR